MSGGNVAYNVRPNKYVERQLFIELISKVSSGKAPNSYVYTSMGGPQLEDHKLIHHQLGLKNLISLEQDPYVYARQKFNLRPVYVECRNMSTQEFVTDFDVFTQKYSDKQWIIWFDYASPDRKAQILEFQSLLTKLQIGDICKITLNANPGTLGERRAGESPEIAQARQLTKLQETLGDYLPSSLSPKQMVAREFAKVLCAAVRKAALNAMAEHTGVSIMPLATFLYQDGQHPMLTITVCLVPYNQTTAWKQDLEKLEWDYVPSNWDSITRINVPLLTPLERLHLEARLPTDDNEQVHKEMSFQFDSDESASLAILEEYARHYRRYPSYFQVVL